MKKRSLNPLFFLKACPGKCPSLGSSMGCFARRGGHCLWLRRLRAATRHRTSTAVNGTIMEDEQQGSVCSGHENILCCKHLNPKQEQLYFIIEVPICLTTCYIGDSTISHLRRFLKIKKEAL